MTPLDIANNYIGRAWSPISVPYKSKAPNIPGWPELRITCETAPSYFNGVPLNIGVLLGAASRGLTDVDIDFDEAVAVAPFFLPKTNAIFGRPGRPASHWFYETPLAEAGLPAPIVYADPCAPKGEKGTLVELRIGAGDNGEGAAAQTVVPGSVHPSGEPVAWERGKDGDPTPVAGADLVNAVQLVAASALLARYCPNGSRHDTALALGGMFAHSGWVEAQAKLFVQAVARAAGDDEWKDRERAVEDSYARRRTGEHVVGFPSLIKLIDERVARCVAEWLGIVDESGRRNAQPGPTISAGELSWRAGLISSKGTPLSILANVLIALRTAPEIANAFTYDEMLRAPILDRPLPSATIEHAPLDALPEPRPLRDTDVTQLQEWLQHKGLQKIGRDTVHQAVMLRANERAFHPLRDYLCGLKWDGIERVPDWLSRYLGAESNVISLRHRPHVSRWHGRSHFRAGMQIRLHACTRRPARCSEIDRLPNTRRRILLGQSARHYAERQRRCSARARKMADRDCRAVGNGTGRRCPSKSLPEQAGRAI